jgi:hypothetical protein
VVYRQTKNAGSTKKENLTDNFWEKLKRIKIKTIMTIMREFADI